MCVRTFTCRECGKEQENSGKRGPVAACCRNCKAQRRRLREDGWSAPMSCKRCGSEFHACGTRGRLSKFCSPNCRKAHRRETQPPPSYTLRCEFCCAAFSCHHKKRRYCSQCLPIFKPPAERFTCIRCGDEFTRKDVSGNAFFKYCSRECWKWQLREEREFLGKLDAIIDAAQKARRSAERKLRHEQRERKALVEAQEKRPCFVCGGTLLNPFGRGYHKVCSEECRRARRRKTKQKGSQKHTVRAKRRGLPRVYSITLKKVAARDGYVCQLCGARTLMFHVDGNPMSPSVDHIVPIGHPRNTSHGHTWNNTQLACRGCNERKGAAIECESLLFAADPRIAVADVRMRHGLMFTREVHQKNKTKIFSKTPRPFNA